MQKFFLLGAALSFLALGASAEVENVAEIDSLLEAEIAAWDIWLHQVLVVAYGI